MMAAKHLQNKVESALELIQQHLNQHLDQFADGASSADQLYEHSCRVVMDLLCYSMALTRTSTEHRIHDWPSMLSWCTAMTTSADPLFSLPALSSKQIQNLLTSFEEVTDSGMPTESLGAVYEQLLARSFQFRDGALHQQPASTRRKTGTHYSPEKLCAFVVERALGPHLADRSACEILQLRVCDPAMGCGAFLLAALRFLAKRLVEQWLKEGHPSTEALWKQARKAVAIQCLYGADLNAGAVTVAAQSLWLEVGDDSLSFSKLRAQFYCGESLLGLSDSAVLHSMIDEWDSLSIQQHRNAADFWSWTRYCLAGVSKRIRQVELSTALSQLQNIHTKALTVPEHWKPVHWSLDFHSVLVRGGFDAVVGNPPFLNAIQKQVSPEIKQALRERYPIIRGASDLSYYFLELSTELVRSGGSIGLILPRAALGARALKEFRCSPERPDPTVIYSPNHHRFFADAAIKIAVCVLGGPKQPLMVSDSDSIEGAQWNSAPSLEHSWIPFQGSWWTAFWLGVEGRTLPCTAKAQALVESNFIVHAGLTTGDYYALNVVDSRSGTGLKLLTSGGIDPNCHFWGQSARKQRFRGQGYRYPRIVDAGYGPSLSKRLRRSTRPKIIVANLTQRLECFLDRDGEFQAATATQTIFHCRDDVLELERLCALLHSDYSHCFFHAVLGHNAMHSNISVEKAFLEYFPLPSSD